MNANSQLERDLPGHLQAIAGSGAPDYADAILQTTTRARQKPAWAFPARWLGARVGNAGRSTSPAIPWGIVGLAALLLLGLVIGTAVVAGGLPRPPRLSQLVTYSSGGDIYVGDVGTGKTKAIVSGPEVDSFAMFSPDGAYVAFQRGTKPSEASIVVVNRDGSEARTVVPAGFSNKGMNFAWTPDGTSIVVNYDRNHTVDYDGLLARFAISGSDQPMEMTPPMPQMPGTGYFGANWVEVARMFRPPSGDRILSAQRDARGGPALSGLTPAILEWDRDLLTATELHPSGLNVPLPYTFGEPEWSPDGSTITFWVGADTSAVGASGGQFAMNADGTGVRRLPTDSYLLWSPDSTRVAFKQCNRDPQQPGGVIVVLDVASGRTSVLEPTRVSTKQEGASGPGRGDVALYCSYYTEPNGRDWDFEGWSWTPDGRSIVWLENAGDHPQVIDVESGTVTELPWAADSPASWRAVPVDAAP